MNELQLRASLCEVGRWLWQKGLVGALEGNMSVRLGKDRLLCTPTGKNKGFLKPDDLVRIDLEGRADSNGLPSSEVRLHLECYAQRPDCQAVVHAHPPVATGMALAHETIPDNLVPEAAVVLGSVALVPFAMPGTDEMRDAIRPFLEDHKTFLLANHGAVALGSDLYDAYARMETLERVANVCLYARLLGEPRPLPNEAFDRLLTTGLNGRL